MIESPGFPDKYPHNLECNFIIIAPPRMDIILTFLTFDLENDPLIIGESDCKYDWLELWDGLPQGESRLDGLLALQQVVDRAGGHCWSEIRKVNKQLGGAGPRATMCKQLNATTHGALCPPQQRQQRLICALACDTLQAVAKNRVQSPGFTPGRPESHYVRYLRYLSRVGIAAVLMFNRTQVPGYFIFIRLRVQDVTPSQNERAWQARESWDSRATRVKQVWGGETFLFPGVSPWPPHLSLCLVFLRGRASPSG